MQCISPELCRFLGRRHDETLHALVQSASEKRQGTKSREVRHRRCSGLRDLAGLCEKMAGQARDEMAVETLEVVADRGYYDGEEIRACEEADITVTLPKPMTSSAKAAGRFGKQNFVYLVADDVYRCPVGERLTYHYTNVEDGKTLRRYWTSTCKTCALKARCTTGPERRISRWEHEAVLEKVQDRLDHNPNAMGVRRQTAEHPFGTMKCWMGATHFLTKKLPKVATEMALNVLAYNMKRVMTIMGVGGLLEAMRA